MSYVVEFEPRLARLRIDAARPGARNVVASSVVDPLLLKRLAALQAKAKGEIEEAISRLDRAVSSIRKAARLIADPDISWLIQHQLGSIEEALELAHAKALDL